jgi:hypothetical protein
MSGQRSDWRERLRANPSRTEQELAIKLQEDGVHYQTQVEIGSNDSRLLLPAGDKALARVCRRLGPSRDNANGKGQGTTNSITEKGIQNPRTILRELFGQEKRPAIQGSLRNPEKDITQEVDALEGEGAV